jgi:hypothetical protein
MPKFVEGGRWYMSPESEFVIEVKLTVLFTVKQERKKYKKFR